MCYKVRNNMGYESYLSPRLKYPITVINVLQFHLAQIQEVLHCNGFDSSLSIALVATYVVFLYFPPQAGSSCDKAAREGGIKCGPLSS